MFYIQHVAWRLRNRLIIMGKASLTFTHFTHHLLSCSASPTHTTCSHHCPQQCSVCLVHSSPPLLLCFPYTHYMQPSLPSTVQCLPCTLITSSLALLPLHALHAAIIALNSAVFALYTHHLLSCSASPTHTTCSHHCPQQCSVCLVHSSPPLLLCFPYTHYMQPSLPSTVQCLPCTLITSSLALLPLHTLHAAIIALNSAVFALWRVRPLANLMERYFISSTTNREL